MTAILLAAVAGTLVLHTSGFRCRWPWRLADLTRDRGAGDDRGRDVMTIPPPVARGRRRDRDLLRSLPLTTDLLLVALSSGHSIHSAIAAVSGFDDGPAGRVLGEAWSGFVNGSALVDELRALPRVHGDVLRPLVGTLVMGLATGAALEPALHRLADRQRSMVRRRTEERVRRLPVLLLGPLVVFVLPSFALLTIVPVVLVAARGAGL